MIPGLYSSITASEHKNKTATAEKTHTQLTDNAWLSYYVMLQWHFKLLNCATMKLRDGGFQQCYKLIISAFITCFFLWLDIIPQISVNFDSFWYHTSLFNWLVWDMHMYSSKKKLGVVEKITRNVSVALSGESRLKYLFFQCQSLTSRLNIDITAAVHICVL